MDSSLATVRSFEAASITLFVAGLYWVIRRRSPFYLGAYLGSCFAGVYFDWISSLNWFLRVKIDERFLPIYSIGGWPQPLAMSTTYAFYFGVPVLFLFHHQAALQRRFGPVGQYAVVYAAGGLLLLLFEIPLIRFLPLWKYYQKDAFLLGGVPWMTCFYSALAFLLIYAALHYVQRVVGLGGSAAVPGVLQQRAGVIFGFGAFVAAFAVAQFVQMMLYTFIDPWIPSPRPF